jgi:uncharacterized protein
MHRFEFDPIESKKNRSKHGIDFVTWQGIWKDEDRIERSVPSLTERRVQVLGHAMGGLWSAIITYRGEMIRIISIRRARRYERKQYEKEKQEEGGAHG